MPGTDQVPGDIDSISESHRPVNEEQSSQDLKLSRLSLQFEKVLHSIDGLCERIESMENRHAQLSSTVKDIVRNQTEVNDCVERLSLQFGKMSSKVDSVAANQKEMADNITSFEARQAQMEAELAVVHVGVSLSLKGLSIVYLEFDHGRVVIELDIEDCPRTREFLLTLMRQNDRAQNNIILRYDFRYGDGSHVLRCNSHFDMWRSGDKRNKKDGRSQWGLIWHSCGENETSFLLSRDEGLNDCIGLVVQGEEILGMDPDREFVLGGYGVVE